MFLLAFVHLAHGGLVSVYPTQRSDGLCATLVLPHKTYACQEFVAQTGDGFLLGIQRMSSLAYPGDKGDPVLLLHGILTGGDVYVINPPGEGFGFILADAGYDVWILNFRSTDFSYGHISFKKADEGFWDWSVDELASEDVITSLELIQSITMRKTLLVGFSQGSQATLAAFSQGLGNDLVSKAVLMAPVAYLTSGPQLLMAASVLQLQKIYESLHMYELSTRGPQGRALVDLICSASSTTCYRDWFRVFSGYTCCINSTRRSFIDKYETQATSVKNLDHFSQQIRLKTFAKYDYGTSGNLQLYNQATPPAYEVSKYPSSANTLFISSINDSLANVVDVAHLLTEVPAGFQVKTVQDFGHLDFVFGYNANRVVYDAVLEFLGPAV